ncbi:hypothetical protein [Ureibacillus chungkukjangi]|uniref:Uncharacterized protein n=1 Tax=Ureibacillus chungkukjangi TaxID=1202712 RepID=A0A318TBR5_9BACL|nr:hypothetical protein [Ureibacillus chungkukjangi]MCM3389428.1 hypothetical protein [Ureibacillus chungkukjangi]PYF02472.1 hypothetical protein BJ095_1416 [Ureibacillus chungkukjangi]
MDLYNSWIYVNMLNAKWFIWTIVIFVFTFNILAPMLVWTVINGKGVPFVHQKEKGDKKGKQGNKKQKKSKKTENKKNSGSNDNEEKTEDKESKGNKEETQQDSGQDKEKNSSQDEN